MLTKKSYIKKDDKVKVIVGKDQGKIGKVLKVDRKKKSRPGRKDKHGQASQQADEPEQTGWNC
jgi:ribosomal protein L24